MSIYDDFLKELECQGCRSYLTPPILQCNSGHNTCNSCRIRLPNCPQCHTAFTFTRNHSLETLAGKVQYPCVNNHLGCRAQMILADREKHIQICPHMGFSCAMDKCLWVGRKEDITAHWFSKASKSKPYTEDNICHSKMNDKRNYVNLVQAYGELFWYKFQCNEEEIAWIVQYIGPKQQSNNYIYEIVIQQAPNKKPTILLSDYCQAFDIPKTETFNENHCMMMKKICLKRLMDNPNSSLNYRLRIWKANQEKGRETPARQFTKNRSHSKGPRGGGKSMEFRQSQGKNPFV